MASKPLTLPEKAVRIARLLGIGVLMLSLIVLAGWALDNPLLKFQQQNQPAMRPNTALGVAMGALALLFLVNGQPASSRRRQSAALACALVAGALGAATLAEFLLRMDLGIDQLLFRVPNSDGGTPFPGRMSPQAAVNLVLLGAALSCATRRRLALAAQALAVLVVLAGLFNMVGFVYGSEAFYRIQSYIPIAAATSAAVMALGLGVLLARPEVGLMRAFTNPSPGSYIVHRLLLAVLVLPILLDWIFSKVERAGILSRASCEGLSTVVGSLVLIVLIWQMGANLLHAKEQLEHRVGLRTAQLENTNRELSGEITDRERTQEALQTSEEHYRSVTQTAMDAIVTADARGNILAWNLAAERIFGYRSDEVRGKPLEMIMPPRYRDQHSGGMRRVLAGGEAHIIGRTVEVEGLHRDGHEFPVELALSRWATASGKFFTAIIRDITERRQAEETLRINSTALTAADNAIIIADRNGLIEWVNPAFTALTGYTAAEAMGRDPRDLAKSGKDDDAFYKELWATLLSGKVWRNEIVSRRKDGSLYTESMTVTPVPDKKGGIGHFIAIKEDITVRKSAESRIREQAEIIDKAPLIIVVSDLSSRTTSFSKGASHLLGIKREEALGRTADELFSAQTMRHLGHGRSVAMATGLWRGEVPFQTRDGRSITVEFLMFLIRDDAGRPIGRISIGTDITEKKQFEEQALRAQRIENLGTLAAGIAHDFNNALAPIIMAGPLLQKLVTDPSAQQMLNIVNTSSARSAALVRQMLSFARGTSGEKLLAQIDHVLREVIDLARSSFPKSIEIYMDLPNDLWPIMGDPTQMHQVFLNLCVNARDAMPEGGKLTVAARNRVLDAAQAAKIEGGRAGNFLTVEVRDTGTGIAPEVLEKMFEPFFTTKGLGKGTGLGLSTVLGIVSHHDGFVSVHTSTARDRGHGTEFTVYLPAAAGEVAGPPEAHGNLPQRGRGELILVVDDEESVRAICAKVLISQGYQVVTATDGVNAIEVFGKHTHEIKLLLTDAQMPGLGGAALVSALRRMNPGLPVISMSGAEAPSGKEHRMSAEAFLSKPFEAMTLLVMVRRQLDEASGPLKQRPAT